MGSMPHRTGFIDAPFAADLSVSRTIRVTSTFEINAAEAGFLTATLDDPAAVAKEFRWVHVPGLPAQQVQFWRATVRSGAHQDREHLLIMAHYPPLAAGTRDAIAALVRPLFPQAVLSFLAEDGPGRANIHAASHAAEAAAVVAEVKRRGGWDASPAFSIVVGEMPFLVTLRWVGAGSTAAVTEQAG